MKALKPIGRDSLNTGNSTAVQRQQAVTLVTAYSSSKQLLLSALQSKEQKKLV